MKDFGWDLSQGTHLPRWTMIREELHPWERSNGLSGHNNLISTSSTDLTGHVSLPWMNSAEILAKVRSLPSFTTIREKFHPGEQELT